MTAKLINTQCEQVADRRPQFAGLTFTPHDFRRLFATDLVNNGLPIHIGAALLGHASLHPRLRRGVRRDVVRHYQLHLSRRRQLRPTVEYRDPSDEEWQEFDEHFDTGKVELDTLDGRTGRRARTSMPACAVRCCRSNPGWSRGWTRSSPTFIFVDNVPWLRAGGARWRASS